MRKAFPYRLRLSKPGEDAALNRFAGCCRVKELGSNEAIMDKRIFEQEQIAHAVELGLGVSRPWDIEIVTDDVDGRQYAERSRKILEQG